MTKRGRPAGYRDNGWPDRMITLLAAIESIQKSRHTTSLRELAESCQVSYQSICNWVRIAEELGLLDRHDGRPRALQLLPEGRKLVRKFAKEVNV